MTGRTIARRDLLGLAGAAALCASCSSGSPAPVAVTRSSGAAVSPSPTATQPRPSAGASTPIISRTPTVDLPDLAHGPRTKPQVALTFHGAGPSALTRAVMSELANAHVNVTVFAVGQWLAADPSLARLILDGGHELGNHTYTHLPMRRLASTTAMSEVARCAAVLKALTGSKGQWFRPSGTQLSTATIRAAARASGYDRCLTYDVDSLDWTDPGADAVVRQVLVKARMGSIVSLHLGHPSTVSALPRVLSGLAARSLAPVTVSALVA